MTAAHPRVLFALLSALFLGGCMTSAIRPGDDELVPGRRDALRFDNEGRDRVDVYLVGETKSWRLGRLEPGQARWLPLPGDIPPAELGRLQLAVIANGAPTLDPARDPRAVTTIRQPVTALAELRWAFAFGQLKSAGSVPR